MISMLPAMNSPPSTRRASIPGVLAALALLLAAEPCLRGEQLPVRHLTTTEGLAGDDVRSILQDRRGFLWIGTRTGLSRFDGKSFRNYDTRDGLPGIVISDILESRDGSLWFATSGGLARIDPIARPGGQPFISIPVGSSGTSVDALVQDREGRIWANAGPRLFAIEGTNETVHVREFDYPLPVPDFPSTIEALAADSEGSLWIGTGQGLIRRLPNGRMVHYAVWPRNNGDRVYALLVDQEGRIWITQWNLEHRRGIHWGLYVLKPRSVTEEITGPDRPLMAVAREPGASEGTDRRLELPDEPGEVLYLTGGMALGDPRVFGAYQTLDGAVWFSTEEGVVRLEHGIARRLGREGGVPDYGIQLVAQDRDGNVWLGTRSEGLLRLVPGGLISFDQRHGLRSRGINSIFEDRAGGLCVAGMDRGGLFVARFDGHGFHSVRPAGTGSISYWGWGWNQTILLDRAGELWVPTGEGLFRYPTVESCDQLAVTAPRAVYTRRDGLPSDDVFRLFEDSRGDLWISTGSFPLTRWRRSTESFEPVETSRANGGATAFAEDKAGNVWMGFYVGGLARFRDGTVEQFDEEDGIPPGFVGDLHVDRAGRLWAATGRGGLARIEDPSARVPRPTTYTRTEGLSSEVVLSLAEDGRGRIYIGTGRGVDRLEPETGRIRRYSTADGLASNSAGVAYTDRNGSVWFGTLHGLSRLAPASEPEPSPPSVFIEALRIGGAPHPLSALGETSISGLELEHGERRVEIDYSGINLTPGEVLHYQTRLAGVDEGWSPPTEERSVLYGNLGAGSYRFLVRAINSEGMVGRPASVAFRVLPPFWQRPWFLAPLLLLTALGGFAVHRYRVQRLVAVERVRTQIATDLHDDLGARLSRVSILSEAATRLIGRDDARVRQLLGEMGDTSRGLIDAAGDIAWSIDPRRDDVGSLVARIRRFASDTLDGRGISWSFEAPPDGVDRLLDPEQRRHLLLVFQEAIHNVIRHSAASRVELALRFADGRVETEIRDDGHGFAAIDIAEDHAGGRGLLNMRERAKALGGRLDVDSGPGWGTRIRIRAPLTTARTRVSWPRLFRRRALRRILFGRGDRNA